LIASFKRLIQSVLNPKAAYSFGRFMALWMTAFVIGWDTANLVFAWRMNHIIAAQRLATPLLSLLPDAGVMLAQGGFCTLFYGVTKYGDIRGADTANLQGTGAPQS
jgi:hypothetical protein